MSNINNENIKETIFEDLLAEGFSEEQIEKNDMVNQIFFKDIKTGGYIKKDIKG